MTLDLNAIRAAAEAAIKKYGGYPVTDPAFVIALLDRLEAAEKDAARYRWLRDTGDETWIPLKSRLRGSNKAEAHIDTAIAAMKEQK